MRVLSISAKWVVLMMNTIFLKFKVLMFVCVIINFLCCFVSSGDNQRWKKYKKSYYCIFQTSVWQFESCIMLNLNDTFWLTIDIFSQDISEATEFHPLVSSSVDVATKHELCIFESNIEIHQISVTLFSKYVLFSVYRHFMEYFYW